MQRYSADHKKTVPRNESPSLEKVVEIDDDGKKVSINGKKNVTSLKPTSICNRRDGYNNTNEGDDDDSEKNITNDELLKNCKEINAFSEQLSLDIFKHVKLHLF